jgi:hypothetical protein
MEAPLLWIDQRITETQWTGVSLNPQRDYSEMNFKGQVTFFTQQWRETLECTVSSTHIGSVARLCWQIDPPLPFSPPFFVSERSELSVIYWGKAEVSLAPFYLSFVSRWRALRLTVAGEGWKGVLVVTKEGFFRTRLQALLFAVSLNGAAVPSLGPLRSLYPPDEIVGELVALLDTMPSRG